MDVQDVRALALQTIEHLADLGVSRTYKDGTIDHPRMAHVYMSESGEWAIFEIDTTYTPPGARLSNILKPATLHELQIRLNLPVYPLNTTGVSLAVQLATPDKLPTFAPLDLTALPGDAFAIPIGQGRYGPVWRTLDQTSHILVGGESRGGKTTWLNAVLASLLARHPPEELQLVLLDGKAVEFAYLSDIPHLRNRPVAVSPDDAIDALNYVADEMDQRQVQFQAAFARNLQMFNERCAGVGLEPLPRIVVVIDEVTDLAMQAGAAFNDPLVRIASKGASFGITLILSTQNPKFSVMDTLIKGNLSVRVSFRVATDAHSRVILGSVGAEKLPRTIRGRLMARIDSDLVELQGYIVDDDTLYRLANAVRGHKLDVTTRMSNARVRPMRDIEMEMARFARDGYGGKFVVQTVFEAFKGRIAFHDLVALCQIWERKGWLTVPAFQGEARQLTPKLLDLIEG